MLTTPMTAGIGATWENGAPGARMGPRGRSANCGTGLSAQCVRLRSEINPDRCRKYTRVQAVNERPFPVKGMSLLQLLSNSENNWPAAPQPPRASFREQHCPSRHSRSQHTAALRIRQSAKWAPWPKQASVPKRNNIGVVSQYSVVLKRAIT